MHSYKPDKDFLKLLEANIKDIFKKNFLRGSGRVNVTIPKELIEFQGATGARLFEVNTNIKFIIKFQKNKEEIEREKSGRDLLKKKCRFFAEKHLIPILFTDETIEDETLKLLLIEPFLIDSLTFHNFIWKRRFRKEDLKWAKNVYKNFLNENLFLWYHTSKRIKPNISKLYIGRILERKKAIQNVIGLKSDLFEYTVYLNGQKYIIKEIINDFKKLLIDIEKEIKFSCLIHGDEHADNLIVKKINIGKHNTNYIEDWKLIDYANVIEDGDWIQSICKMLHWWIAYYRIKNIRDGFTESTDFKLDINEEEKIIKCDYIRDPKKLDVYDDLIDIILNFVFNSANESFNEKRTYIEKRIGIGLFALFFGAISRHAEADKKFAIPILLSEALLAIEDYKVF